jgi:HK97 family phage portal protein
MRGIFGRIAGTPVQRASAGVPSYGMIPPLGSIPSASGLLISQATAMTVSSVYACVRRRAVDVARCTPSLYRLKDDGSREPVTGHPLNALFDRPNRQQTWFEWMEQQQVAYLLRGNAYAAIKRDGRGDPNELIPINPDAVMVLEAGDGSIFYNVNRIGLWQIAMLREFPVAMTEEDILHLRGLTFNSLVAVSTIGLARDAIGLAMGQEQQASRWIGNGARPSGVLKSPKQLTEVAAKRLKASWDEFTYGIQNTGRTAVLEEGVEWQQLQLTSVDLEFLAQRNFSVLEICRFFGVPAHKVGVVDRGTVQNLPQQDQDYVNSTVSQDLERWELKLRHVFGLDKEGLYVDLNESKLLRADILSRRNAARLGILSGLTTINEERRGEHLPPLPGADRLLVPANTAALGSDMTGTAPDKAGRPKDGHLPEPGTSTSGDQPGADDVAPEA